MDGFKLLILIAVIGAGFLLISVGLYLLIRPRASSGRAQIKVFGIEFQSPSEALFLIMIGAIFLGAPVLVPELGITKQPIPEPPMTQNRSAVEPLPEQRAPTTSRSNRSSIVIGQKDNKNIVESTSKLVITDLRMLSDQYISGRIEGLGQHEYNDYKIVVYVLTDQWYIHPFKSGGEGRSFARIKSDGTWKLKTVRRQSQASKLAIVLTKRSTDNPSEIPISSDDPARDLQAATNPIAHHIDNAPEGI